MNKCYSFFILVLFTSNASGGVLGGGELFDSSQKMYDRYQMIDGKMIFQEKDSDLFTSGFRPASFFYIGGATSEKIYDFSRDYSSAGVFNQYRSQLLENNFEILFECAGSACGDIAGWALHLSDKLGGHSHGQYYLAARSAYSQGRQKEHIVLHVANVDDQPRLIVHSVLGSEAQSIYSKPSATLVASDERLTLLHEFYFDSARSDGFDETRLDKLVDQLRMTSNGQEILVVGYADSIGNNQFNNSLALKRARSVKEFLISQKNLDGNLILELNGGILDSGGGDQDMKLLRKVSLYLFNPETKNGPA